MYASLSDFLKTFSGEQPVLWALLVLGVVAASSLALYAFWELVLRLLFSGRSLARRDTRSRE